MEEFVFVFLMIFMVYIAIYYVSLIMTIIGKWTLFTKANVEGWKALIPLYNTYIFGEIAGVNPWWYLIILLSFIISVIFHEFIIFALLIIFYFIITFVLSVAKSFGKGFLFALGLMFMGPIFYMILGLSPNIKYQGRSRVDPIGNLFTSRKPADESNNNVNGQRILKFCPWCGNEFLDTDKFCSKCGKMR